MRKLSIVLAVTAMWLFFPNDSHGQDTNVIVLNTRLEIFEAQIDTVIVKGSAPMGTVAARTGTVAVWSKESQDISTGQKEYGIAVGIRAENGEEDVTILDYDEVDSFLAGIDFIIKVDIQVTSLPSFHAGFTSKGALKISAYTSNKNIGTIQAALQSNHAFKSRVLLEPDQLAKFKIVIQEAKARLDFLQQKKS